MEQLDIDFRSVNKTDHAYIYATWLRTYKEQSVFAQFVPNTIYYNWHARIIKNILEKQFVNAIVIHAKDDPEVILGYLIQEHAPNTMNTVHFIYVKKRFRNFGFAKKLFNHAFPDLMQQSCEYSHCTFDMDRYLRAHPELRGKLVYNPYGI